MSRAPALVSGVLLLLCVWRGTVTASPCLGLSFSFLGSCYRFVEQRTDFRGAQASCLACRSQLANVSDDSVLAFLALHLNQTSSWWVESDTKGLETSVDEGNLKTFCTVLRRSVYSFEVLEATCTQAMRFICQTDDQSCDAESDDASSSTSPGLSIQTSPAVRRRRSAGQSVNFPDLLAMADQLHYLPAEGGGNLSELLVQIDGAMQDEEDRNITELNEKMSLLNNLSKKIRDPSISTTQQVSNLSNVVYFGINAVLQSVLSPCSVIATTSQEKQILVNSALNLMQDLETFLLSSRNQAITPLIVQTPMFSTQLHSMNTSHLGSRVLSFPKDMSGSVAKAVLPSQAAISAALRGLSNVQVQMKSFAQNPFLSDLSFNVSGTVVGLSFTSGLRELHLQNLTDDFQIFLPRSSSNIETPTKIETSAEKGLLLSLRVHPSTSTLVIIVGVTHGVDLLLYRGQNTVTAALETQRDDEDSHTWIFTPDVLPNTTSPHTFFVCASNSSGSQSVQMSVSSFTACCGFWDIDTERWRSTGCKVGPKTTNEQVQCLCNHLTFVGSSFLVLPVQIDVTRTAEYFSKISENPVMVVLLACFYVCYILLVTWARRTDLRDQAQSRVILLRDNDPCALYRYRITVCTGHRRNAATTSMVSLALCGSESQCGPVLLTDGRSQVFKSGSVDVFFLNTPFPLGDLQTITLSHDGTGARKSWYVVQVTAQDMQLKKTWHFLCNAWLSSTPKGETLSKTFPVAKEQELTSFRNIFLRKTLRGLRDEHIWISVLNHPARSAFTRVQRVSCCMCLLLCTIVINLMFWEMPQATYPVLISVGSFSLTWKDVMIGLQSAILMFPVNLLIIFIFRNTRPKEGGTSNAKSKKGCRVPASDGRKNVQSRGRSLSFVTEDLEKIAQTLSPTSRINMEVMPEPARHAGMLLDLISRVLQKQPTLSVSVPWAQLPADELRALFCAHYISRKLRKVSQDLQQLWKLENQGKHQYEDTLAKLQTLTYTLNKTIPPLLVQRSSQKQHTPKKRWLPWWFLVVGWSLLLSISAVSTYFTMMYGFLYGKQSSIRWIVSMSLSLFQSIFILQPLKVVGFAVFFALILKKVDEDEDEEDLIDADDYRTSDDDTIF